MSSQTPDPTTRLREAIEEAWPKAQAHWSDALHLSIPKLDTETEALAFLDLSSRQISIGQNVVLKAQLTSKMEAILAHEVGHHVRYPGSLGLHARLILLERSLVPLEGFSSLNLFTDLLINQQLTPALGSDLRDVYLAFRGSHHSCEDSEGQTSMAFLFVLTLYEELWALDVGALLKEEQKLIKNFYPRYRREAQVLVGRMFQLGPNIFTQFLYFLSILSRYLVSDTEAAIHHLGCQCQAKPSDEDWASALQPGPLEREAFRRAQAEGWWDDESIRRAQGEDAFERRIRHLPGASNSEVSQVPNIMAAWYRQQAEIHLVEPPPRRQWGEDIVPLTYEPWEPGEPTHAINWYETLRQYGDPLGRAFPMRREYIPDEAGWSKPDWYPRTEIYLDVSGSMPDPRFAKNAMTLAAMILSLGTIRAGGAVRALIYSHTTTKFWEWTRSPIEMSQFLMHYIGGGTDFPFAVLSESVDQNLGRQPLRVVISDYDFDSNFKSNRLAPSIVERTAQAAPFILLLEKEPTADEPYTRLGAKVVYVKESTDFPKVASQLADALFHRHKEASP